MLKNYLKIALRHFRKDKAYTFINVSGLAVGLAVCTLIALYIQHELSYDRFHKNADHIYRIAAEITSSEGVSANAGTPHQLAPAMIQDFPELQNTTRFYTFGEALLQAQDKKFYEENCLFVEPSFLNIFTFPLLQGDPKTALQQPNAVILTSSLAQKYFGDADPLGEQIRFNNKATFTVTGVVEDAPANSHFTFDVLVSLESLNEELTGVDLNQWGGYFGTYVYTLLDGAVDPAALEAKIAPALEKYAGKEPNRTARLFLQPLTEIHLYSHIGDELGVNNQAANLYVIAAIGLLILTVAGINFMNLSTARSADRAREVGMRKTLGAEKTQLLRQFLGESILLALAALVVALLLVEFSLPWFNQLINKSLAFVYAQNLPLIGGLLLLTLTVGVVSGVYPAFVLAAFKPVSTLKSAKLQTGNKGRFGLTLRKALVIFQFAVSIILIAATITIQRQLAFVRSANLGFDQELMLTVQMNDESVNKQYDVIKQDWLARPDVKAVTASYKSPIADYGFSTSLYPKGRDGGEQFQINLNFVDYDFINAYGLETLAGRNFSPEFATDPMRTILINEAAMKKLGFTSAEEAVGKIYRLGINKIDGEIIGVVKDFHIASLQEEIKPLVMLYFTEVYSVFSVKIQSADVSETLAALEASWQEFVPEFPFQYRFLDDYINSLYQQEEQTQAMVGVFSGLAVFIACLGLFGLASFSVQKRTKEIGVRKVLGASSRQIAALVSREFLTLVALANLIAWPLAWLATNAWLQNFAYRVEIGWLIFALAGGTALIIALLTVSSQAIKAALSNPVESLKYE
mgnify:CR=1 FL=1